MVSTSDFEAKDPEFKSTWGLNFAHTSWKNLKITWKKGFLTNEKRPKKCWVGTYTKDSPFPQKLFINTTTTTTTTSTTNTIAATTAATDNYSFPKTIKK